MSVEFEKVPFLTISSLLCSRFVKMYTTKKKLHKDNDVEPTEFEETVAQVYFLFLIILVVYIIIIIQRAEVPLLNIL